MLYISDMKFFFLLCGLMMAQVVCTQIDGSAYYCMFKQMNEVTDLHSIKLLFPSASSGIQSDFRPYKRDRVSFTHNPSFGEPVHVQFLDIFQSKKGNLLTSSGGVSLLSLQPTTGHMTFVMHGKKDAIVMRAGNQNKVIFRSNKIRHYTWIDDETIGIIGVDDLEKESCFLYNLKTHKKTDISIHPGKSIHRLSDDELAYIDIFSSDYRYIKSYNLSTQSSKIIAKIPTEVEAFALSDNKEFFIAKDSNILRFIHEKDVSWKMFYSFESYGINRITDIYFIKHNHMIIKNES
jgi:hypothetical protein